jgi:hypothetical protein
MKLAERYAKFVLKHKWLLALIVIGGLIYSTVHEIMHGVAAKALGYGFELGFSFPIFVTHITGLEANPPSIFNALLITAAPYLLDLLLLTSLTIVFMISKNKQVFYLTIFPFLDIVVNIIAVPLAVALNKSNDFLIMNRLGFYSIGLVIAITCFLIFTADCYALQKPCVETG